MKEYIAFDAHKRYTLAERDPIKRGAAQQERIEHERGAIREYLEDAEPGTAVAVETTGNWYWIADEIEEAGCRTALVHAYKAKVMLGCINKTDKLDVHGLNRLQRTGTLPTVWVPPSEIRDRRELPRIRMFLVNHRGRLKNRIQAELTKYGVPVLGVSDTFGVKGQQIMRANLTLLPPVTRRMTELLLEQYAYVDEQVRQTERQIQEMIEVSPAMQGLMTIPGIGRILASVIALEVGDVQRFASAQHLASYAGTTPRVHSSGDKTRYGRLRQDVNRHLKWAFIEAANGVCMNRRRSTHRHVSCLYERLAKHKGHAKAIGAVARHLAEATFYVLSRNEAYRDPRLNRGDPKGA
jgi:transposase